MKLLKPLLASGLTALFIPLSANAFLITETRTNVTEVTGEHSIDAKAYGYNPLTDYIVGMRLSLRFREILDDSEFDSPGSETSEFVTYSSRLGLGDPREFYHDVDTGDEITHARALEPGQQICFYEDGCEEDPLQTGIFSVGLWSSGNLLLERVYWELDVLRPTVDADEPSTLFLLIPGALLLLRAHRSEQKRAHFTSSN